MKCSKDYELQVLHSNAGYYIGTLDEFGAPNCRLTNYYQSKDDASNDLDHKSYKVRDAVEVNWCHQND